MRDGMADVRVIVGSSNVGELVGCADRSCTTPDGGGGSWAGGCFWLNECMWMHRDDRMGWIDDMRSHCWLWEIAEKALMK